MSDFLASNWLHLVALGLAATYTALSWCRIRELRRLRDIERRIAVLWPETRRP